MQIDRRLLRSFDWPLFLSALSVPLLGLIVLYSAGYDPDAEHPILDWIPFTVHSPVFAKQCVFLAGGLLVMSLAALLPTTFLAKYAYPFFGVMVAMLVAVDVVGVVVKGSQRWLDLGPINFQPSELSKMAVILAMARYLSRNPAPRGGYSFKQVIVPFLIFLVPMGLILGQPDLGTALAVGMVGFAMVLFAGIRWKVLVVLGVVGLSGLYPAWNHLHDYQKRRVLMLFNPEADPLGSGYHIIQSKIAVGSGQLTGKGYLRGTQTQLQFLPEHTTDFIFSVLAEEWGFIGCFVVLMAYGFFLYRLIRVVIKSRDLHSCLLVVGLTALIFCHAAINIGMVVGLLPVVGIPLPLFSYGGSSMLTTSLAVGLALGVSIRRKLFLTRG